MSVPAAASPAASTASDRRLRIAFVYDALYPYLKGGAERRVHELANRLADRHDVHLVSWQFWDGESDQTDGSVHRHGVGRAPNLYGGDGKRTVREAASFALRLMPAIARGGYDVIDCSATPYVPLYGCWAAARMTGVPVVATWHEFWGEHWDEYLAHRPLLARAARAAEASALRLGDRHVAVSAFTAQRLADAGLEPERIRVVENGVALDAYRSVQRSPIRSDLVFVGRLIEDKRVDLLIHAVASLREALPDLRCLVIGDGPERPRLEAEAAALGVSDQVRFLGQLAEDDKIALLKASRVFVMPSVREGFGIAVVEAQAAGLAPIVVRSEHSAAPALVRDGVDGLICSPRPDGLGAAIQGLLTDPDRLASMRAAAAQTAERWDWEQMALAMERVYLDVARPAESADAAVRRLSWG